MFDHTDLSKEMNSIVFPSTKLYKNATRSSHLKLKSGSHMTVVQKMFGTISSVKVRTDTREEGGV